jgi:hypothetical protein
LVQQTFADVDADGSLTGLAKQSERPVCYSMAAVKVLAQLLDQGPVARGRQTKALLPPSDLELSVDALGGSDVHSRNGSFGEIRTERGASKDAVVGTRLVNWVVEREGVENGLLASPESL